MQTLNRVHFEIGKSQEDPNLFENAAAIVLKWASERRIVTSKEDIPNEICSMPDREVGDGVKIQCLEASHDGRWAWGLRLRHPDEVNDWLQWSTEVTLLRKHDGSIHYSNTLLITRTGDFVAPVHRAPTNPAVNRGVLDGVGGKTVNGFQLTSKPIRLRNSGKEVAVFIRVLESRERTHPIVYVTPFANGEFVANFNMLARLLAGMAHVVVAEDPETTRHVESMLPRILNCFDGGIRIYWPGFRRHSNPLYHPLIKGWDVQRLCEEKFALGGRLVSSIAQTAAFSLSDDFLTWPRLESLARQEALAKAREGGDSEQLVTLFEEENSRLSDELRETQGELSLLSMLLSEEKARSEQLAVALRHARMPEDYPAEEESPLPDSVEEALRQIEEDYEGQLLFRLNAKSERTQDFDRPGELFSALTWLATTWHDAKCGKVPNANLEMDLKTSLPGWEYRPHQKKATMQNHKWREWYRTLMDDGREIVLGPHIAYGVSGNPKDCIRIAFNWDAVTKQVIIGYIGPHQTNSNT